MTNTQRCLYDGGDCCLEDKRMHLCKVCTCIKDVNKDDLNTKMIENNVKAIKSDYDLVTNFKVMKTVFEVLSVDVCTVICFEAMEKDKQGIDGINSWIYQRIKGNNTCFCTHFEDCYKDKDMISLDNVNVANHGTKQPGLQQGFGILTRLVKCGE